MDRLEARLQTQVTRLQRILQPATTAACKEIAARMQPRLPALLASPNWEANLQAEVRREAEVHAFGGSIIAAVLMVIAAILVLIGEVLQKAKEDQAAAKEKELQAMKDKLEKAIGGPLADAERKSDQELTAHRPDR